MERTYSYKGCRPYGAGDLFVMDHYVDDDFVGNVPEEIVKNNGGKWDADKLILTMPSGVEAAFIKEES